MNHINLPKIFKPFICDGLVRLGKDYDGGYLVNAEDVHNSSRLISFGIDNDVSFENDFLNINKVPIDAYDDKIDRCFDNMRTYRQTITKGSIEDILRHDNNVFLKCDIEGSEYDILSEIITNSHRFSGMVIEFHDIHEYSKFNELTAFIAKISQKLVHVHVNNHVYIVQDNTHFIPMTIELTFSSSKRIQYSDLVYLPNTLDMPNMHDRPDFRITFE